MLIKSNQLKFFTSVCKVQSVRVIMHLELCIYFVFIFIIMVIDFFDHAACSYLAMTVNSDKRSPLPKVAVFHPLHFCRVMCPLKLFSFLEFLISPAVFVLCHMLLR